MIHVRAGFIPLVDAAVLIAAADRGFAEEEGVGLELVREVSWANVRDKLNLGHFQAAHILAPLALAQSLGLDGAAVELSAVMTLSENGNSILFGNEAHDALVEQAFGGLLDDPAVSGAALRRLIVDRAARGEPKLTFGMTFPYSSHNYLLRYWMAAAGVDPDEDVHLVVLPPTYMIDALVSGQVHGFCVGAPWPSLAVDRGVGTIVHLGTDIVAKCPEKVLAVRSDWAKENSTAALGLMRALIRSMAWCSDAEHRHELAHLLAAPSRLNTSADLVLRALEGRVTVNAAGRVRVEGDYLVIPRGGAEPDTRHALWLFAQMVRWQQARLTRESQAEVLRCYAPTLYEVALSSMIQAPAAGDGLGEFDGPAFDPRDLATYLAKFAVPA